MYDDFDTLTRNIIEVSPQALVRKKVTGFDLTAALVQLRSQIDHLHNAADFGVLVRKAITLCQDAHTSLIWEGYFQIEEYGISKEAMSLLHVYDSLLRKAAVKPFNLRLKYLKGEYYTVGDFEYKNKDFPSGLKVIECNGTNIHDYVKGLLGDVRSMRWDFQNKRYFSENFFTGFNFKKEDSFTLRFQDRKGHLMSVNFQLSDTLAYGKDNYPLISFNNSADTFKTVEYFPKEQVLYIRVPRMRVEYLNYYPAMIQQEGRKGLIKKVIIDIRNNPGGADNVWISILENIIAQPLNYQSVLLCNNSHIIKTKLLNATQDRNTYTVTFLDSSDYIIYHKGEVVIEPDSNTIGYKGKVYLLQDENIYSSAGSFTAVAQLASNIVSVGTGTGKLLGRGINPLVFELPNSKILYRIEPVIDFLNVKTVEDVFHDKVEIPIDLSLGDYMNRLKAKEFLYSRDFLFRKDPVFKKILKLNK